MISTNTDLPLHDETSGVANLDARQAQENAQWNRGFITGAVWATAGLLVLIAINALL